MGSLKEHLDDRLSIYVLIGVISGLMFYYNLVYVPTNEQRLHEHALRIMDNKVRMLKEKYTTYQTAINSAPTSYFVYWYFTMHPDSNKVFLLKNGTTFHYSWSKKILKGISGRSVIDSFTRNDFWHIRVDMNLVPQLKGPEKQGKDKDIWKLKNGEYYLVFSPDINFRELAKEEGAKGKNGKDTFKIKTDTVFQYFWLNAKKFTSNVKSNDFFEDLFLIRDAKDKIKYDQNNLEISAFDDPVLDHSNLNLVRLSLPPEAGNTGVGIYDEKISGQNHKVYYKLVKLKRGLNVFTVGLISTQSFQKIARQIPGWFLVFSTLGILILILLFPVLKLFFLNEHERLSAMDARLSVFSIVMCGSLLMIVLCGSYIFWVPEQQKHLKAVTDLAKKIQSSFSAEVDTLRSSLRDSCLLCDTNEKKNAMLYDSLHQGVKYNEVFTLTDRGFMANIFFSDTSKINNVEKLPIRLVDRNYYKAVSTALKNHQSMDYHIEAINSLTSGTGEVAIAIPYAQVSPKPSAMRVITSTLHSVVNAQVPSPYKYAIVDRTGEIKFHSDSREVRFENFIKECSSDKILQAYLENQIEGSINFNYLRSDCQGYCLPLRKGWSLVVYYELETSRAFAAQVFSMCLITLTLIAVFILSIQAILSFDHRRHVLLKTRTFFYNWLNPNVNASPVWLSLAWMNLFLFLLELAWLFVNQSTLLTLLFILIIIVSAYFIAYGKVTRPYKRSEASRARRVLLVLIGSLSILFIVMILGYENSWSGLLLLPLLLVHLFANVFNGNKNLQKLKKKITGFALPRYTAYRIFLFSSLFVLGVGPSILFVTDHYAFQNFIRGYSYLLEDVKKVQVKSGNENDSNKGAEYILTPKDSGKFVPVTEKHLDFAFYKAMPRYSLHEADVSGMNFNYIPNYTSDAVFVSPSSVMIKAPASNLDGEKKPDLVRYRSLHTNLLQFNTTAFVIGVLTLVVMVVILWLMHRIPGKIFFMPHSLISYPVRYEPSDLSKNVVEREFEHDNLPMHPLYSFSSTDEGKKKKEEYLKDYQIILEEKHGYTRRLKTEELLLTIQKDADKSYAEKWKTLENDDAQRFLLFDLADDGVTNQTETGLFSKLSENGLLRLQPQLEVVNTSFANYVREVMPKEKIKEWRTTESRKGRWNNLRIGLIIIIISAFGFLSVAEEDFLGRVSALLASVAVAIPNMISSIGQITRLFKGGNEA